MGFRSFVKKNIKKINFAKDIIVATTTKVLVEKLSSKIELLLQFTKSNFTNQNFYMAFIGIAFIVMYMVMTSLYENFVEPYLDGQPVLAEEQPVLLAE